MGRLSIATEGSRSKFSSRVYALTRKIPRGRVTTYQDLARQLQSPRAARAVGRALSKSPGMVKNLPASRQVPCHRIIRSDGLVGGFALGTRTKILLLRKEGVVVRNGRVDLRKFGWRK